MHRQSRKKRKKMPTEEEGEEEKRSNFTFGQRQNDATSMTERSLSLSAFLRTRFVPFS